jgi:hypothetical protein
MTLGGVLGGEQVRLRAVDGVRLWDFTEKVDDKQLKKIRWQLSTLFTIQALTPLFFIFFSTTRPFSITTIGVLVQAAISLARFAARRNATPTLAKISS